jgi:hypothetical protein
MEKWPEIVVRETVLNWEMVTINVLGDARQSKCNFGTVL